MADEHGEDRGLEEMLAATEADADEALGTVKRLQAAVAASRKAAGAGDLRALRRALAAAEDSLGDAAETASRLREGWPLSEEDETALLSSGAYAGELMRHAERAGLAIIDQDGVLSSYPSLVRAAPRLRAVTIDRKTHRSIRPTRLVAHLLALRDREPALRTQQFLDTLHSAYAILAPEPGVMVSLVEVHRLLTLLPGTARDYGVQDFARDVYLLDRSGHTTTRAGARLRLSAGASSARNRRNLLLVVTRDGAEKSYYGVEFTPAGAS